MKKVKLAMIGATELFLISVFAVLGFYAAFSIVLGLVSRFIGGAIWAVCWTVCAYIGLRVDERQRKKRVRFIKKTIRGL